MSALAVRPAAAGRQLALSRPRSLPRAASFRPSTSFSRISFVSCRAEAQDSATTATPATPTDKKKELMAQIKSYGVAGTLSYVITELVFWAIALPGAYFGYHTTTGEWLSLETDRAQLLGLAAAFVTGVRFAVPLRMGAALALIPTVKKIIDKQ